nr:hypothetical protein [Sphingobacterium sp. JB170]
MLLYGLLDGRYAKIWMHAVDRPAVSDLCRDTYPGLCKYTEALVHATDTDLVPVRPYRNPYILGLGFPVHFPQLQGHPPAPVRMHHIP